jgi:hypothetical protein
MKTLIAAVAFATVFAAPAFAQCWNSWGSWGPPASAKSAYAASFNDRRSALSDRRSEGFGRCAPARHWAQWRSSTC